MNERIKKIGEKAADYPDMFGLYHFNIPEIEKFAELIIEECAEFARQHNLEKADRSHMIHRAIKEHFGVEE